MKAGTVKIDGYLVCFTADGQWVISRLDQVLGYVDSLAEATTMIETHHTRIRARLALAQRKANERKAENDPGWAASGWGRG